MRKNINKKLRSNKGITMIVLSIAIITLAILTSMIAYYSTDAIEIKKLNNMYNDIEQLEEKVSIYFYENEKIPMLIEYPDVETVLGEQKENLDGDKYYVLDLSKLKNIELNYGKDFEKIKENNSDVQSYEDVYVINGESHNVYYLQGIEVEEKLYHARPQTDEEQVEMKTTKIDSIEDLVRFQQSVAKGKIYENEYVVLTKNLDFDNPNSYDRTEVIIDSVKYTYGGTNDLQSYLGEGGTGWTPIGDETNKFLGTFEGNEHKITNFYSKDSKDKVLFGEIIEPIENVEVEWKKTEETSIWNGAVARTTPWIPYGFSRVKETNLKNGFTITNTTDGTIGLQNYVWIEVPITISASLSRNDEETEVILAEARDNEEILDILETYVGKGTTQDYTKGSSSQSYSYKDEWYDSSGKTKEGGATNLEDTNGCGMTYNQYQETYSYMLNSIKKYGGFWLAQYEAGVSYEKGPRIEHTEITVPKANYAKDQYPYNWICCSEAQIIANADTVEGKYTSSLLFGIQWDLVCEFLEKKTEMEYIDIAKNSMWGNYANMSYTTSNLSKYYISSNGSYKEGPYSKGSSISAILTTGAIEKFEMDDEEWYIANPMNIYDLAGNMGEFILEHPNLYLTEPSGSRGGYYTKNSESYPVSYRTSGISIKGYSERYGFRSTLYTNEK